jgi:hypothetical protein
VFGGFCLLFVFAMPSFPVWGCGFLMPVFGVFLLGQACSDSNSTCPFGMGCFCLESLILAQDERWRRA